MSVRHEEISIASKKREETIDITPRVKAAVTRAKIGDGIVTVSVAHTTAAVFVNENADPDVQKDVLTAVRSTRMPRATVPRTSNQSLSVTRSRSRCARVRSRSEHGRAFTLRSSMARGNEARP